MSSSRAARVAPLRFTLYAFLIAGVFFAGTAPTLTWRDFCGGSENLVVVTVLEMRRGGPWIIPTLQGAARTTKPPLTNWICAMVVRPRTVQALSDLQQREAAYRALAWEVRWPALATSCATLVVAAWLGRILVTDAAGLTAAAMMGSTLLFLRFGRDMTTDVQLALWVTTANMFFAMALFEGRRWLGCVAGGAALGLALMSKGPVALAQTIAPLAALFLWMGWTKRLRRETRIGWAPVAVGAITALAIALPWPVWVLSHMSGQIGFWWQELAHGGSNDYVADPLWSYLSLIPNILPWTAFFFLGAPLLFQAKTERAMLALILVVAPIAVMTCFSQKNERYLLPMLAPAAVVCAAGLVERAKDIERIRQIVAGLTWITLLIIAVGFPLTGAIFLKRIGGAHWWSLQFALVTAAVGVAILGLAWFVDPTRLRSLVPAAVTLMIWSQFLFNFGYTDSRRGHSAGKPVTDAIAASFPPDCDVWCYGPPGRFSRVPTDLPIYLNRIIRQAAEPTTLPTSGKPCVMLVFCRKQEPPPAFLADWSPIGSFSENNGIWSAYARPN
jgi:4-amino-4-deoxy-L-arabinose transferase-like glycosyltransferase